MPVKNTFKSHVWKILKSLTNWSDFSSEHCLIKIKFLYLFDSNVWLYINKWVLPTILPFLHPHKIKLTFLKIHVIMITFQYKLDICKQMFRSSFYLVKSPGVGFLHVKCLEDIISVASTYVQLSVWYMLVLGEIKWGWRHLQDS